MVTLAAALKGVRKDLDKNQAEMARFTGLSQAAISDYESGKIVPSRTVLLIYAQLAKSESDRNEIIASLGSSGSVAKEWRERELFKAVGEFESWLEKRDSSRTRSLSKQAAFAEFTRVVADLVGLAGEGIEPAVVDILRLYRDHRDRAGTAELLRDVAAYLDMELAERAKKRRGKKQ